MLRIEDFQNESYPEYKSPLDTGTSQTNIGTVIDTGTSRPNSPTGSGEKAGCFTCGKEETTEYNVLPNTPILDVATISNDVHEPATGDRKGNTGIIWLAIIAVLGSFILFE